MRVSSAAALGLAALGAGCEPAGGTGPGNSPAVLWEVPQGGYGPPAVDAHTVYFATPAHELVAVDRATGAVRWRAASDGAIGGSTLDIQDRPLILDDLALFGDGALYAFDVRTGERRWVFGGVAAGVGTAPGTRRFATDGQRVYTGSLAGWAFAVEPATGVQAWSTPLAPGLNSRVEVAAADAGLVYVLVRRDGPLFTGEVHALDAATGAVRWTYTLPPDPGRLNAPGEGVLTRVGPAPPMLVVSYDDGRIVALDAADGSVRWLVSRPATQGGRDNYRRITVADDVVVASSTAAPPEEDFLAAYDVTTGTERWRVTPGQGSILATMTSDAESVFAVFLNGTLGAFDLRTGRRQWLRTTPGGYTSGPAVGDDVLYVPGVRSLHALRR